jgi:hypothetical protein
MEIVTLPDLRSPEEAGAYVRTLQALLRAVGASDGNMEQVRVLSLYASPSSHETRDPFAVTSTSL